MDESASLRAVEAEIDGEYRHHRLMTYPRGQALWAVLSSVEEWSIAPLVTGKQRSVHDHGAGVDYLINVLKYALRWVSSSCSEGDELRRSYEAVLYRAAQDLIDLATQYHTFEAIFNYWSNDELQMKLDGNRLVTLHGFATEVEYESYNALMGYRGDQDAPPAAEQLYGMIDSAVRVDRERFSIKVNPQFVDTVMKTFESAFCERFSLPEDWTFSRYSLRQFRAVYLTMFTLSALQSRARVVAIQQDCPNFGIADAVFVTSKQDLLRRVARYSGVNVTVVQPIFDDLEYGGGGQRNPDPALQPLIHLVRDQYAISPTLWLYAAPERNLCVLLNRIPDEHEIYSRLVDQKEALMRFELGQAAEKAGFRVVHGKVPGRDDLGDVDIALVSDADRECILLELKWFIAPAEIREIRDRRKELLRGVSQLRLLSGAFREQSPQLLGMLNLPANSTLSTAVVSKNWIGDSVLQRQDTPVIMQHHFLAKLAASHRLGEVASWLNRKGYLPVRGKDFEIETGTVVVGKWSTEWYLIRGLIDSVFLPL